MGGEGTKPEVVEGQSEFPLEVGGHLGKLNCLGVVQGRDYFKLLVAFDILVDVVDNGLDVVS